MHSVCPVVVASPPTAKELRRDPPSEGRRRDSWRAGCLGSCPPPILWHFRVVSICARRGPCCWRWGRRKGRGAAFPYGTRKSAHHGPSRTDSVVSAGSNLVFFLSSNTLVPQSRFLTRFRLGSSLVSALIPPGIGSVATSIDAYDASAIACQDIFKSLMDPLPSSAAAAAPGGAGQSAAAGAAGAGSSKSGAGSGTAAGGSGLTGRAAVLWASLSPEVRGPKS